MWQSPWDNAVRGGDRWRTRCGRSRPGVFGTVSGSAIRAICRPATPIWCWPRWARSSVSFGLLGGHLSTRRSRGADSHRDAGGVDYGSSWGTRVTLFGRAGAADGGRRARPDAAHRRGDAVPQLRRFGDGRQLRRPRYPRRDCPVTAADAKAPTVPRSPAIAGRHARGSRRVIVGVPLHVQPLRPITSS